MSRKIEEWKENMQAMTDFNDSRLLRGKQSTRCSLRVGREQLFTSVLQCSHAGLQLQGINFIVLRPKRTKENNPSQPTSIQPAKQTATKRPQILRKQIL